MSYAQKAALLMIALGQRWATEIMRMLRPEEIKKVSYWVTRMDYVPQELTEKVVKEFYERLIRKTSLSSLGGKSYLLDILSGMMGEAKAREMIDDLTNNEEAEVFRILKKVDPKQLAAYLKPEQPQTIALMLSYLDAMRSAMILSEFPQETRTKVIMRLARLEETDPHVIEVMESALNESLGNMAAGHQMKKIGGPKIVAEILNNLHKDVEKDIMDELTEKDFELATEIKELMFVFDDLVLLDDKSIQTVLKEIDQSDLIMALKGSSLAVKDKIFKNISKRQAETIDDELAFLGPVKASTVQSSQMKIVNLIRKLDEEGKILIQGKGSGDEIIE